MLNFLDSYFYMLTYVAIIISGIILSFTNGKVFILKHQIKIAYAFAFCQFVIYLYNFSYYITNWGWGDVLFHDLCPALSFISIILFIWNKKKAYKPFMPWFLVGASITMLGGSAPIFSNAHYINSYFEHSLMLMQGIFTYWIVGKYTNKELAQILIFPAILILWNYLSGLLPWKITGNDYWAYYSIGMFKPAVAESSAFYILSQISWLPHPISTIVFFALSVGISVLIVKSKFYYPYYQEKIMKRINSRK